MKKGFLSSYFDGVATKTLTVVETDQTRSNQHEFQGVAGLREMLGKPHDKVKFKAKFVYMTDDEPIVSDGFLTWSDVRRKNPKRSAEYHLYYSNTEVSKRMSPDDLLIIAKCKDGTILVVIAEPESTSAKQLLWLFNFTDDATPRFSIREELESDQDRLFFTSRMILETIGINVDGTEDTFLDDMISRFGKAFPEPDVFSRYVRSTLPDVSARDCPDMAMMAWLDREEILYRTFEKHILGDRLQEGFSVKDTENDGGFCPYSKTIEEDRKQHLYNALKNHTEAMLQEIGVLFDWCKIGTMLVPAFVFPDRDKYFDLRFSDKKLDLLGVESVCQKTWHRILMGTDRIALKHLLTLETSVSPKLTDEMVFCRIQLVVPKKIHETYSTEQRNRLWSIADFVKYLQSK